MLFKVTYLVLIPWDINSDITVHSCVFLLQVLLLNWHHIPPCCSVTSQSFIWRACHQCLLVRWYHVAVGILVGVFQLLLNSLYHSEWVIVDQSGIICSSRAIEYLDVSVCLNGIHWTLLPHWLCIPAAVRIWRQSLPVSLGYWTPVIKRATSYCNKHWASFQPYQNMFTVHEPLDWVKPVIQKTTRDGRYPELSNSWYVTFLGLHVYCNVLSGR